MKFYARRFLSFRLLFFVFLCFCFLSLGNAISRAFPITVGALRQANPVQLQVDAGFQGHFRVGQWTPVRVILHNSGAPISGIVRVTPGTLNANSSAFTTPIDLPSGADKQVTIYATFDINAQQVQVDLLDANRLLVVSATVPVNFTDPTDALYGVVNGAPTNAIDLTGSHQANATAYPIRLATDTLPDSPMALDSLDALVFASTDTGRLSTSQRNAIADWVRDGGRLIIIGGPDWQTTAAGLDALLPFHPTGSASFDNLNALAGYAGSAGSQVNLASLTAATILAQGTVDPAARVVLAQADQPLLIERPVGSGAVDYLTFDPDLTPFSTWSDRAAFWQHLLITSGIPRPGWANGLAVTNAATDAASLLVGVQLPQVAVVAGFLVIYILLIGPANYLILRAGRRLEWAWFTIPALIAIATLGAYQIGLSLRGTQPILTRLSVVQSWPGQDRARLDGVIGLTAPQQSHYDLAADSVSLQPLTVSASGNLFNGPTGSTISETVTSNIARTTLTSIPLASEVTKSYSVFGSVPAPALNGTATVTLRSDGSLDLVGQVTNQTGQPLENAHLIMLDTAFPIGNPPYTVAAGQTIPFSFIANPPPVQAVPQVTPFVLAANNQLSALTSDQHKPPASALGLLLNTIPVETAVSGADVINLTDRRVQARREALLGAFVRADELGGGRGLQVFLVGWQTTPAFQASLNISDIRAENDTFDIAALTMIINTRVKYAVLTPGYLTWKPIDVSTLSGLPGSNTGISNGAEASPYGLYVSANSKAAFEFSPRPGLHVTQITSLSLFGQIKNTDAGILSLWDWSANQWIIVAQPDVSLSAPERFAVNDAASLARFVDPEGRVRVLVTAVNGIADYDRLDVSLGATLDFPISPSAG